MSETTLSREQHVRPAKDSDIAACAELLREWLASAEQMAVGQNIDLNFDHASALRKSMNADDEAFFVAEDADGVQGFITLRGHGGRNRDLIGKLGLMARKALTGGKIKQPGVRNVGIVDHVVVRPGKRNNYMSLVLFKAGTQWCIDRKLVAIEGTVWAANTRILRVSERVGFKPVRVLLRKDLA